jgi:hypothetical protein
VTRQTTAPAAPLPHVFLRSAQAKGGTPDLSTRLPTDFPRLSLSFPPEQFSTIICGARVTVLRTRVDKGLEEQADLKRWE